MKPLCFHAWVQDYNRTACHLVCLSRSQPQYCPGWNVTLNSTMVAHMRKYHSPSPPRPAACSTLPTKTLQDFTEPQEAQCLFMEIWYVCVPSLFLIFFNIFVCQESSQEFPCFPQTLHFWKCYFHIVLHTIVLHLISALQRARLSLSFPIAVVTRSHHYCACSCFLLIWAMNK